MVNCFQHSLIASNCHRVIAIPTLFQIFLKLLAQKLPMFLSFYCTSTFTLFTSKSQCTAAKFRRDRCHYSQRLKDRGKTNFWLVKTATIPFSFLAAIMTLTNGLLTLFASSTNDTVYASAGFETHGHKDMGIQAHGFWKVKSPTKTALAT